MATRIPKCQSTRWLLVCGYLLGCCGMLGAEERQQSSDIITLSLPAGPGPLDNPLKGWCQYPNVKSSWQSASMVFHYASWKDLEPLEGQYNFDAWEAQVWNVPRLADKHVVLRIFADYPKRPSGVPDWLIAKGVKLRPYQDHGGGMSPDYDHPAMREATQKLIAAFGARYNDDPRVAFIELGILGHWGEWHTFPRNELFASNETQRLVIDAYHEAFPNKQLMARTAENYAGSLAWMGYHDDLFPEDTDNGHEWSFLAKMRRAHRDQNWRVAPVGGEMVPGGAVKWMAKNFETTLKMAERAHFTWVGPYCPLNVERPSKEMMQACETLVRRMGYEFRLTHARHLRLLQRDKAFSFSIRGGNQGVAPFYYPWKVRVALLDQDGQVADSADTDWDIRAWQPDQVFVEKSSLTFHKIEPGKYQLALGIIDPWRQVARVQFANRLGFINGWTVLSEVEVTH